MSMPFFRPGDDPGSSFPDLLRRIGLAPAEAVDTHSLAVPHATTCVAMRYADGVLMAGDRRATSGNLISHRAMEKVVQADQFSGVAIAGAAGPAMEMIKLFQLQLEHYEKVEGTSLSLEGKANQLSMMVRSNLPAAMQGMVVVPIFAGFDTRRLGGRLWTYDVTGGRYEEHEYVATGFRQPPRRHGDQGRLPREHGPRRRTGTGLPRPVGSGRRRLGHGRPRRTARHLPRGRHDLRRRLAARRRRGARRHVPADRQ